jgi:O-antigen/teichoic acid export membrane protein
MELNRTLGSLRDGGQRILQSALLHSGALSLVIHAQYLLMDFLCGILLARNLGPAGFGTFSFALSVLRLIQIMPASGLNTVVVRYSAKYRAQGSWASLRGLWRMALIASSLYGLLSAVPTAGAYFLGWIPRTEALSPSVLAIAAIPMLFMPLTTLSGAALRVVSSGVVGQLPQFTVRPLAFLAMLMAVLAASPHALTPDVAMYIQGAAAVSAALTGAFWWYRRQPEQLGQVPPAYELRRWLRAVVPCSLLGGLMLISTQADILMLGLLGTAHQVGLYRVAVSGANLVMMPLIAVSLYIEPQVSVMYSQGERVGLQRLLSLSARCSFGIALATTCVFWIFGTELLRLAFGWPYSKAFWPLAILCLGQLINVGTGSVTLVLTMTGHEGYAASVAGLAAVLNVALNAVLIPHLGGVGTAISTTVAMVTWNALMLIGVKNKTGLNAAIFGMKPADGETYPSSR